MQSNNGRGRGGGGGGGGEPSQRQGQQNGRRNLQSSDQEESQQRSTSMSGRGSSNVPSQPRHTVTTAYHPGSGHGGSTSHARASQPGAEEAGPAGPRGDRMAISSILTSEGHKSEPASQHDPMEIISTTTQQLSLSSLTATASPTNLRHQPPGQNLWSWETYPHPSQRARRPEEHDMRSQETRVAEGDEIYRLPAAAVSTGQAELIEREEIGVASHDSQQRTLQTKPMLSARGDEELKPMRKFDSCVRKKTEMRYGDPCWAFSAYKQECKYSVDKRYGPRAKETPKGKPKSPVICINCHDIAPKNLSRVHCNMELPSCSNCLEKGVVCQYPLDGRKRARKSKAGMSTESQKIDNPPLEARGPTQHATGSTGYELMLLSGDVPPVDAPPQIEGSTWVNGVGRVQSVLMAPIAPAPPGATGWIPSTTFGEPAWYYPPRVAPDQLMGPAGAALIASGSGRGQESLPPSGRASTGGQGVAQSGHGSGRRKPSGNTSKRKLGDDDKLKGGKDAKRGR